MEAIDKSKYDVTPVGITKEGRWLTGGDPMKALQAQARTLIPADVSNGSEAEAEAASTALAPRTPSSEQLAPLDVIFPVLHGPFGEDGTVQGLLELAGIPYVGSGVAASAVGMDKALMKAVFRAEGLPVADYLVFKRRDWEAQPERVMQQIEERLGYPCFAKPANLGSSVGISKIHDRREVRAALDLAAQFDRKILVEQGIDGRELECSVLGNDQPLASVVGEVIPCHEFYDYEAKYVAADSELLIPADLPEAIAEEVRHLAVRAFLALDCAGLARVDFFLERGTDRVLVNELNTIPGFTSISMYPKLWAASGLSYPDLIDRLIELALERHEDKMRSATSI